MANSLDALSDALGIGAPPGSSADGVLSPPAECTGLCGVFAGVIGLVDSIVQHMSDITRAMAEQSGGGGGSPGDGDGGGDDEDPDETATDRAERILESLDTTGRKPEGYKGGQTWNNRAGDLPNSDSAGNPITYQERDITPSIRGVDCGAERLVTGSDGSAYLTTDHYGTFTRLR